jgi:hypothetical protein
VGFLALARWSLGLSLLVVPAGGARACVACHWQRQRPPLASADARCIRGLSVPRWKGPPPAHAPARNARGAASDSPRALWHCVALWTDPGPEGSRATGGPRRATHSEVPARPRRRPAQHGRGGFAGEAASESPSYVPAPAGHAHGSKWPASGPGPGPPGEAGVQSQTDPASFGLWQRPRVGEPGLANQYLRIWNARGC